MVYYDGDFDPFLEDRLKRFKAARSPKVGTRSKKGIIGSFNFNRKLVWLAVSYLTVVGLLFGSVGTAFAAMDSLPNEPLYSVKLIGEDLQLLLTSDTTARISLLTTFANRRAVETTILASQGQSISERVNALIDEYQDEITALAASLEDESVLEGVYIQRQPRDRDADEIGDPNRAVERIGHPDPAPVTEDQTNATIDLEIRDTTISITGTIGITCTMKLTPTRTGENWGSDSCEKVGGCDSLREEHSPGPSTYSHVDDMDPAPYAPGIHEGYGPGYAGVTPQQPPTTNPPMDSESSNQPTENKGNKP